MNLRNRLVQQVFVNAETARRNRKEVEAEEAEKKAGELRIRF